MTETQQELLRLAKLAYQNAHCIYSHFPVGSAIKTEEGNFFSGSNVENASYGISRCAESSSIGAMVTAGDRHIAEILIYTESQRDCLPCGGCRQQISEFAKPDTIIYAAGPEGIRSRYTLKQLLPEAFNLHLFKETS